MMVSIALIKGGLTLCLVSLAGEGINYDIDRCVASACYAATLETNITLLLLL